MQADIETLDDREKLALSLNIGRMKQTSSLEGPGAMTRETHSIKENILNKRGRGLPMFQKLSHDDGDFQLCYPLCPSWTLNLIQRATYVSHEAQTSTTTFSICSSRSRSS